MKTENGIDIIDTVAAAFLYDATNSNDARSLCPKNFYLWQRYPVQDTSLDLRGGTFVSRECSSKLKISALIINLQHCIVSIVWSRMFVQRRRSVIKSRSKDED